MSGGALAGRCACGVAFAVFLKRDWDAHLRCIGLRWCGVKGCGEVAPFRGQCSCRNRPTPAKRKRARQLAQLERDLNAPTYQRDKAAKRKRYAKDPAHRAAKLAAWARRWGKGTANYERRKAAQRQRYRTDPAYRAQRLAEAKLYRDTLRDAQLAEQKGEAA